MQWSKGLQHKQKQPTARSRNVRNHRFSQDYFYDDNDNDDDDDDNTMRKPIESEISVEVKVRPEFGVGGARGKLLLLQSCRKKGASIQRNEDDISTFLELLEKQQREQYSFDASSVTDKKHGVGYKKQNSIVRPKAATWLRNDDHSQDEEDPMEEYHQELMDSNGSSSDESPKTKPLHNFRTTVMDWVDQKPFSKSTTRDPSLVFGIFRKTTRQEEQQCPAPCVPPDFDPHHVFIKEEEDHLDELLISFHKDLISTASKIGPTNISNDKSSINYYVTAPSAPVPLLSLNKESPSPSATVKDDLALALNQRFLPSTGISTTVLQPEKQDTANHSTTPSVWKRNIFSFQPAPLLCKRFLLPAPKPIQNIQSIPTDAVHTSTPKPILFATSSSLAPTSSNNDDDHVSIPMSKGPIHVNISSIISKHEPDEAPMNFLKSIFEPSIIDAVGHSGGGRANLIDSKQAFHYRDMGKKQQPLYSEHRLDEHKIMNDKNQYQPFQQRGVNNVPNDASNNKPLHSQVANSQRLDNNDTDNSLHERMQSSSRRVNKGTTNSSFRETSTDTSSSTSSNIRKDMKRKRRKRERRSSSESCSSRSSSSEAAIRRRQSRKKRRKRERVESSNRRCKYGERDSKKKKKKRSAKK